ncbi:MAG: SRPBCC family protein [Candidatus Ranarchaeia archaeon]
MAYYMKTIVINALPEKVFTVITDLEKIKKMNPHIIDVHIVSERKTGVGTRTHFVMETPSTGHVEWEEEIIEWYPNHIYAYKTVGGEIEVTGRRMVEKMPDGNRTRLTFIETLKGKPWDFKFDSDIDESLETLKRFVETKAG